MITTILTVYSRPQTLEKQVEAVRNQTVKCDEILIWCNQSPSGLHIPEIEGVKWIASNHNWKFHGRFLLPLLAKNKWIALFDDDVIPGPKWFESCLKWQKTHPGIHGSTGVVLHKKAYLPNHKFGWNATKNTDIQRVDLVGHSWFFEKEWSRYMWRDEPVSWKNAEDCQFSFMCQKYGGIQTWVPPHPLNNRDIWGHDPHKAPNWGGDDNATFLHDPTHYGERDRVCKVLIQKGWDTVRKIK